MRTPLDHLLPKTPIDGDISVGEYVATRLGREVVDRLAAEDMDAANATPAQMDDARRSELTKWSKIVKQLDLRFD